MNKENNDLSPDKIDWEYYFERYLDKRRSSKEKDWNDIAKQFKEWMKNDDYPEKLIAEIETKPDYKVLDIGCGEGVITVPIAKKVAEVTVIERSEKMLELLEERAEDEGVDNIKIINKDYRNIDFKELGKFDIIIASRSIQLSRNIKELFRDLNHIGKTIYMTTWGPGRNKYLKLASEALNREYQSDYSFIFIYNILYKMGIVADVKKLKCENILTYESFEEAYDRYSWKFDDLSLEDEKTLRKHLNEVLDKQENGTLLNKNEKSDWILIYWENNL